jgi:hypothetical protein
MGANFLDSPVPPPKQVFPPRHEQIFIHSIFGTVESISKFFVSVGGTIIARINMSYAVSLTSTLRPLQMNANQIISFAI